jgi:hypothetical protein
MTRASHRLFNLDTGPSMIEFAVWKTDLRGALLAARKHHEGGRVGNGWTETCMMAGCRYVDFSVDKCLREIQFPSGNDQKEFVERRVRIHGEKHRRTRHNMWITGDVVCIGLATAVAWIMT